jgi:hypothetical protein
MNRAGFLDITASVLYDWLVKVKYYYTLRTSNLTVAQTVACGLLCNVYSSATFDSTSRTIDADHSFVDVDLTAHDFIKHATSITPLETVVKLEPTNERSM